MKDEKALNAEQEKCFSSLLMAFVSSSTALKLLASHQWNMPTEAH